MTNSNSGIIIYDGKVAAQNIAVGTNAAINDHSGRDCPANSVFDIAAAIDILRAELDELQLTRAARGDADNTLKQLHAAAESQAPNQEHMHTALRSIATLLKDGGAVLDGATALGKALACLATSLGVSLLL
jgi:hypothetical protein